MIIEVVGKEIEKIKGDFESYLNGLNMVGEISYSQYSELYDEGTKQIQKAYELGKSELEKENAELKTDNDARKFAMAMSGKVEKQLREENAELKDYNKKLLQSDIDKQNKIVLLSKKVNDLQKENVGLKDELNKAKVIINKWHFVKDGEYPTHSNRVLVFTDEGVGFGIYGHDNKKWYTYDTGFDVIAWKEIVLPQESE